MNRCEIADFLGLTVETISRNFTRFKVSRVIRLKSNSEIEILKPAMLEAIADGNDPRLLE